MSLTSINATPCSKLISNLNPSPSWTKGYDSDVVRAYVNQLGGVAVIAVNSSRNQKPAFDQHLYRERHRIENLFSRLKSFRRIATRYEKLHLTFAAMLTLACLLIWLKF
jgi:transposase